MLADCFFRAARIRLLLFLLVLVLLPACEPRVVISIDEKVPPTFNLSGTGTVPFFVMVDLGDERENDKSQKPGSNILWKITPNSAKAGTVPFGPITYGILPAGWSQTVPAQGAPPPLVEGHVYHAGGPEIEMPEGVVKFRVRDEKVFRL